MKNLRIFVFSLLTLPSLVFALSIDAEGSDIYSTALNVLAKQSKATKVAVWSEVFRADEIVERKVPRQEPESQFARAIPGITTELQLELLYAAGRDEPEINSEFVLSLPGVKFLGLVNPSNLSDLESASKNDKLESHSLIVKVSRIAFNKNRSKALVYTESAEVGSSSSSGDAFLFVREGSRWKLKSYAGLWFGASPFWDR